MDKSELLKMLDILMEDITPEQVQKLTEFSLKFKNPSDITLQEAKKLIDESGIDIEMLQKKSRKKRAEELEKNRKPRIGANELCPCASQKKYKQCCRDKESLVRPVENKIEK